MNNLMTTTAMHLFLPPLSKNVIDWLGGRTGGILWGEKTFGMLIDDLHSTYYDVFPDGRMVKREKK